MGSVRSSRPWWRPTARDTPTRSQRQPSFASQVRPMRLAARLFASVLLLTLSLPVGAALADPGDTLVIGLSTTEVAGVVDHSLTVTAQLAGITDPLYAGTVTFTSSD